MGQLRDRMAADLTIAAYSAGTTKIYLRHARQFAAYFMRSPAEMGGDEIRRYLVHLVEERQLSRETLRQARAGLKFLYGVTLRRPLEVEWIPAPRRQKRLPLVLSGSEVTALLATVRRPMYRAIITTMYASGLRIREACCLRPEHVDSRRMLIRLVGKGDAERQTVLSRRLLRELRDYWKQTRPLEPWLFPGQKRGHHISVGAVRTVFRKALAEAGVRKQATPHCLRHSFATHLLELGTDVKIVQALLGHKSLDTTEVYLHVSAKQIARTTSPFDVLGTSDGDILG